MSAALLSLAHCGSVTDVFHFDDVHVIEENPFIRDVRNVPRFFTDATTFSTNPANQTYRPVLSLTFAVDYAIGGGAARQYHRTQLFLLLATGLLFLPLARSVFAAAGATSERSFWMAVVTSMFFCVHVGNTQPVNYISARSELLAGIGVLGAFTLYIGSSTARRHRLYLIPMVLGALAKTPALMFAPLLLLYRSTVRPRDEETHDNGTRAFRKQLRYSAPDLMVAGMLLLFVEAMGSPTQTYGGGDRWLYAATQFWVWLRYVRLFLVPTGLTADTDLVPVPSWLDPRVLAGLFAFTMLAAAAIRLSRRPRGRPVAFGIGWFILVLFPTAFAPLTEVTNDHRMYLPYMGLVIAAVWAMTLFAERVFQRVGWAPRRGALVATWLLVLLAHAAGSRARSRIWHSRETLWADVVAKSPGNARGWMNYGVSLLRARQPASASAALDRARELAPGNALIEANSGYARLALADSAAAEVHFARAAELARRDPAGQQAPRVLRLLEARSRRAPRGIP